MLASELLTQTLSQLRALGFNNGSRFYGRVLLPRELQESAELRESVGCRWKTIDYHCDIVGNRLVLTQYKWEPVKDENGSPVLKEDGTQKVQLVPGKFIDGCPLLIEGKLVVLKVTAWAVCNILVLRATWIRVKVNSSPLIPVLQYRVSILVYFAGY